MPPMAPVNQSIWSVVLKSTIGRKCLNAHRPVGGFRDPARSVADVMRRPAKVVDSRRSEDGDHMKCTCPVGGIIAIPAYVFHVVVDLEAV